MSQQPSIGRVVHYVSYGTPGGEYHSQCRAATIAEVGGWEDVQLTEQPADGQTPRTRQVVQEWDDERCALVVQNPTGQFFNTCPHDEDGHEGGTWHWPERSEELRTVVADEHGNAHGEVVRKFGAAPPGTVVPDRFRGDAHDMIPRPARQPGPDVP